MTIRSNYCQAPNCEKLRDKKQGSSYCTMHRVRRSRYKSLDLPKKELPEGIAKICIYHGAITEKDIYRVPGRNWLNCKICKNIRYKKFKENNPNYKPTRNYIFIGRPHSIRISIKEYEKIFKEQDGVCEICKNKEMLKSNGKKIKRLAIDHCHKTKKIRGLLCQLCNTGIGNLRHSTEILESSIEYLKKHNK